MPAYRFSWDAFSDQTIRGLAEALGYEAGGPETAREFLAACVKRPTTEFVKENLDTLRDYWLPEYRGLNQIVERLIDAGIGPMGRPRTPRGYHQYMQKVRNCRSVRELILEAMIRFGDQDRQVEELDPCAPPRRFSILRAADQPADSRRPYDYQREAWAALDGHLRESQTTGVFQGLLVMPTGAGKTFTAVHWLMERILRGGGRLLWVAHRHELLDQAAVEIQRQAYLARPDHALRLRIVSGRHCHLSTVDPADDVVVASVGSLGRGLQARDRILLDPRLFLVIDEAHHAPARSYRELIRLGEQTGKLRVLGLTATPTRMNERERPLLAKLFGGRIIYQAEMKAMIERKVLATPIPVTVHTNAAVEEGLTARDLEYFREYNELSPDWRVRIARMADRNRVIVDAYLRNREKYGKTLVFAIDVVHAHTLADIFAKHGVRADCVASYWFGRDRGDPRAVIQRFRGGELEVLVNVGIMTEGVDVPDIQTVFLTRPTNSEVLLRQMIGRGLRGRAVGGGKDKAYLVSFEDHWERFRDWLSPMKLPDIAEVAETDRPQTRILPVDRALEVLPWDIIMSIVARLQDTPLDQLADVFEAIPYGYYMVETEEDDDSTEALIAVYEHQKPCWDGLFAWLESMPPDEVADLDPTEGFEQFFDDCDRPRPSLDDLGKAVRHFLQNGGRPEYRTLEERAECDPAEVARIIWNQDLGERARSSLIDQRYTDLAKAIYPAPRQYRAAVEDALHEIRCPGDSTRVPRGVPIFADLPDRLLIPGPAHDLAGLLGRVLERGGLLLGSQLPLPHSGKIEWTRRIVKGWSGTAYYSPETPFGHGEIRMNRLLDSPDISEETVAFVLWHEYLHLYLKSLHTPLFREKEKLWPGWEQAEHQLHTLDEQFNIQYW